MARLVKRDAQTQAAQLVQKHVERLRYAGSGHGLTLHDSLVGLAAAIDVITLDGEYLLQDVGGAECFERPNLHLTETLATELCLTAQRLLRDE